MHNYTDDVRQNSVKFVALNVFVYIEQLVCIILSLILLFFSFFFMSYCVVSLDLYTDLPYSMAPLQLPAPVAPAFFPPSLQSHALVGKHILSVESLNKDQVCVLILLYSAIHSYI